MKHYKHQQASSAKEAASSAASGTAALIAGGTDLLGTLKDEILPTYPDTVIDLKTIPDMDAIVEDGDAVTSKAILGVDKRKFPFIPPSLKYWFL